MAYYKLSRFEAKKIMPIKHSLENSLERLRSFHSYYHGSKSIGHWNRRARRRITESQF